MKYLKVIGLCFLTILLYGCKTKESAIGVNDLKFKNGIASSNREIAESEDIKLVFVSIDGSTLNFQIVNTTENGTGGMPEKNLCILHPLCS